MKKVPLYLKNVESKIKDKVVQDKYNSGGHHAARDKELEIYINEKPKQFIINEHQKRPAKGS